MPKLPTTSLGRPLLVALLLVLAAGNSTAQTCVPPPTGIVAWWPLDETGGSLSLDVAGTKPAGHFGGPIHVPGQVGGALRFDGIDDFLSAGDSDQWAFGTANFTLEMWVNFASPGGGTIGHPSHIFIGNDEGPGTRNKWFFALGGGFLNFHINGPTVGSSFLPLVPFSPAVGQWYHLAVTRSGTTFTIFVDGVARGSAVNAIAIPNASAPLTIGQAESLGFMAGRLDEVAVYDRALSAGELLAVSLAGSAGKCHPAQLSTQAVWPSTGGNGGVVTLQIAGTGFTTTTTARLVGVNDEVIAHGTSASADGTSILASFDLTGRPLGVRDVVLTNNDGTSTRLLASFVVEESRLPSLWIDIVGRGFVRREQARPFAIMFGNRGNVDLYDVFLFLKIPSGVPYALDVLPITWGIPALDNVVELPGFIAGGYTYIPLWVYSLPAASSRVLSMSLTVPGSYNAVTLPLRAELLPALPSTTFSRAGDFANFDQSQIFEFVVEAVSRAYEAIQGNLGLPDLNNAGNIAATAVSGRPRLSDQDREALREAYRQKQKEIEKQGTHAGRNFLERVKEFFWQLAKELGHGIDVIPFFDALEEPIVTNVPILIQERINLQDDLIDRLDPCGVTENQFQVQDGVQALDCGSPRLHPVAEVDPAVGNSEDPNDKVGSTGVGPGRYVSGDGSLPYSVFFENLPTATAAAQTVTITDQLDTTTLDLTTFNFGRIAFGSWQFTPPPGQVAFSSSVDLRPTYDLFVRIEGGLDQASGMVTWRFKSVDPTTLGLPDDPSAGFLPPNHLPPEGDGNVTFTVAPKKGLAIGTEIRNQAVIVFDVNAPIATPRWLNTIDNSRPTSHVLPLQPVQSTASFKVEWAGSDQGADVRDFTIYVSDNGGPFELVLARTTLTTSTFTGVPGHAYFFYSIARDWVGNVEGAKTLAEATTFVSVPAVVKCDVDNDSDVDLADLLIIRNANGQLASGQNDPRDGNGDGRINVADLRYCQLRMTAR